MNKLLVIAIALLSSCDLLVPQYGASYDISSEEYVQLHTVFSDKFINTIKDDVYWNKLDTYQYGAYSTFYKTIELNSLYSQSTLIGDAILVHEVVHHWQNTILHNINNTDNKGYSFTMDDLLENKLGIEQTAEVIRLFAILQSTSSVWDGTEEVRLYGVTYKNTPTTQSLLHKVLDKNKITTYSK